MSGTALAQRYLMAFQSGGEIPGGLAFNKVLSQADLDFSPDSLGRIDQLLKQMKAKFKPEYDQFIDKQENQNFLYLLCFYAGAVVSRYTGKSGEWCQYEELLHHIPAQSVADYPNCFATSMAWVFDNDGFYLPLASILEILFKENTSRSLLASADVFMRRAITAPLVIPPTAPMIARTDAQSVAIGDCAKLAGSAAAWAIFMVMEGGVLAPGVMQHKPSGERVIVQPMPADDFHRAIESGRQLLAQNPDRALRAALMFDGYINLPKTRMDALVVEVRDYQQRPVSFSIAIPYRPAGNQAGFAVHSPRLLACSVEQAQYPLLFASFFAGVDQHQPSGVWERVFDQANLV